MASPTRVRLCLALFLLASGSDAIAAREAPPAEAGRAWTPETSVEMRYFPLGFERPRHFPNTTEIRDGAGILFSPDRRYFMFMEYRGDLAADAGLARIHIYESEAVRRAIRSGQRTVAPLRELERRSRSSFLAAMADVRWDEDGAGILFQGVDDDNVRTVYQFMVGSGELRTVASWPVTPRTMLVFDSRRDASVVYTMSRPQALPEDVYPAEWVRRAADGTPQFEGRGGARTAMSVLSASARCAGREAPLPPGATAVWKIAISPTDCRAMLIRQDGATGREWAYDLLDIATGRASRIAAAVNGDDSISWSPDGRWVLLSHIPGAGAGAPRGIALLEAATGRLVPVSGVVAIANVRQAGVHWRSASELVIPDTGSPGGTSLLSLRNGAWERRPAPPPAPAGDGLTVDIPQDFNTPAEVVARLGDRRIVLSRPDPVLAGVRRGRWREIAWAGADGQTRRAALMLPTRPSSGPPPVVVNPYWYERQNGSHSRLFLPDGLHEGAESAAQALAARGIATLWMDGWDAPILGLSPPNEGAAFVERLDGAIAELVRQRLIDPARIGMAGFSRGGFLTLYSATHPGRFAVRTHIGIDNTTGGAAEALVDAAMGLPDQGLGNFATDRAGWDARDTLMNVPRVRGPVLFTLNFNGQSGDPAIRRSNFDVTHLTLFGAFRQARRPFDFVNFPNGEHMLIRPRERLTLMNTIVDWMAFWLLDEAPADPERARVWTQLRTQWQRQQAWEAAGNPVASAPPADFVAPSTPQ